MTPQFAPAASPAAAWPDLTPPTSQPVPNPPSTRWAGTEADGTVVVAPGDTLWEIAARYLGPNATDEQIAAEWPRWWAANRDVIGPDPNLILPGQRLVPPPGS